MNIIDQVLDAMNTQCGDINEVKESVRIVQKYNNADEKCKELIDDVFISLCGYSLKTLIDKAKE
jgi:hypothetical protein